MANHGGLAPSYILSATCDFGDTWSHTILAEKINVPTNPEWSITLEVED